MAGNLWTWGIDYKGQPLLDAWWTPAWTAQNRDGASIQVPPSAFTAPGFPALSYTTVTGNYFDSSANPLSGYLTFYPSAALTFVVDGQTTYMPQRYSGINQTLLGINQMGNSRVYLWYGQLQVSLLATDNANMTPVSFTYHVVEHYIGGLQYDIVVPSADGTAGIDVHSLIIPGSIQSCDEDWNETQDTDEHVSIAATSDQYIVAAITPSSIIGLTFNPVGLPVNFAFISGPTEPQDSDWIAGEWYSGNTNNPPYLAQLLVGPDGYVLPVGTYKIWAQVVATPQVPSIPIGFVTIY